jgi:excisionase family DNA binding protein
MVRPAVYRHLQPPPFLADPDAILDKRPAKDDNGVRLVIAPVEPESGLTTREAAARLGVSERSVRRAIARGELTATKQGRGFRVTAADVARFADRAAGKPQAECAPPTSGAPRPILLSLPVLLQAPVLLPLTPLVGREVELAIARALLVAPETRLLTLTGVLAENAVHENRFRALGVNRVRTADRLLAIAGAVAAR